MNGQEIIEMARQAGLYTKTTVIQSAVPLDQMLTTFAKLVAAKEREACAKVCDESAAYQKKYLNTHAQGVANGCAISIRARGEQ